MGSRGLTIIGLIVLLAGLGCRKSAPPASLLDLAAEGRDEELRLVLDRASYDDALDALIAASSARQAKTAGTLFHHALLSRVDPLLLGRLTGGIGDINLVQEALGRASSAAERSAVLGEAVMGAILEKQASFADQLLGLPDAGSLCQDIRSNERLPASNQAVRLLDSALSTDGRNGKTDVSLAEVVLERFGGQIRSELDARLTRQARERDLSGVELLLRFGAKVNRDPPRKEFRPVSPNSRRQMRLVLVGPQLALNEAIIVFDLDLVGLLIENGADPRLIDSDGLTALDLARLRNFKEVYELLEQQAGPRNGWPPIPKLDSNGRSTKEIAKRPPLKPTGPDLSWIR